MSQNTANAAHKNEGYAEVCIGQMIPTEKGIEMPPQYAYRIDFKGEDVMVIPLEGKTTRKKKMREDIKVETPRQSKNQKSVAKVRRETEKEEDREQA